MERKNIAKPTLQPLKISIPFIFKVSIYYIYSDILILSNKRSTIFCSLWIPNLHFLTKCFRNSCRELLRKTVSIWFPIRICFLHCLRLAACYCYSCVRWWSSIYNQKQKQTNKQTLRFVSCAQTRSVIARFPKFTLVMHFLWTNYLFIYLLFFMYLYSLNSYSVWQLRKRKRDSNFEIPRLRFFNL